MQRNNRTAQRGEIVPLPSGERGRELVSGPATRWLPDDGVDFPVAQLMNLGQSGAMVTIDPALHQTGGSESYETPISNAKGMLLRMIPFAIAWALLTWGIVWVLELSAPFFLLGFAVLTAASFWRMNLDGHEHSRNGTERYRIRAATQVRLDENAKSHELRMTALNGYLRSIERGE